MSESEDANTYREMVDALVQVCRSGQGQVFPQRVRAGVWQRSAAAEELPDSHALNQVLARLSPTERTILAGVLEQQVVTGVFEALKVLENFRITPFERSYEGHPFEDFVGRLNGWEWPAGCERTP